MPGPIVHLIVQQRLSPKLHATIGGAPFAQLLDADPCSPYAAFGSIGPDFLFFSTREYGAAVQDLVDFVFGVYDALEPLRDFNAQYIVPINQAIQANVTQPLDQLLQGLIGSAQHASDLLHGTAVTAAAAVVTAERDFFYPFFPKIQKGRPENQWFWFDLLHYRRTGQFCNQLFRLANGDPDLERYAIGYASHIGTDVVGHPFVNAIVGGPYRAHWHRHKLVENWIDAWARNRYRDLPSVHGCLNVGPDDRYAGNAISGSLWHRLVDFGDQTMPGKLLDVWTAALTGVYGPGGQGSGHPPFLNGDDVQSAYRLWLAWFERATTIGAMTPPVPPPPLGTSGADLFADYLANLPTPPWAGQPPPSSPPSIAKVTSRLASLLDFLWKLVKYTLQYVYDHAAQIALLPIAEALRLVAWLLYYVQVGIYQIWDNLRFMLVLHGYLFPEPRDLAKATWGRAFVNTAFAHATGGPSPNPNAYPLKRPGWNGLAPKYAFVGATEVHLTYPVTTVETRPAEPMPWPFYGKDPDWFIDRPHLPWGPIVNRLFTCTQPYGTNLLATDTVDTLTRLTPQFGNAVDFSAALIARFLRGSMPDFNLDGDRGYAWKTWDIDPVFMPAGKTIDTLIPPGQRVPALYVS